MEPSAPPEKEIDDLRIEEPPIPMKYDHVEPSAPQLDVYFNDDIDGLVLYDDVMHETQQEEVREYLNGNKDDSKICVVCMDGKREYAPSPCHHLCICSNCKDLLNGICPICRGKYQSIIKIYI